MYSLQYTIIPPNITQVQRHTFKSPTPKRKRQRSEAEITQFRVALLQEQALLDEEEIRELKKEKLKLQIRWYKRALGEDPNYLCPTDSTQL